VVAIFPVLGEPTTAAEPGDGSLNDPTFGFNHKALGVISASDDLDDQVAHRFGGTVVEDRPSVGAVGEQFAQEWELSEQGGQQHDTTVAVLDVGCGDQRVQHQA